MEENNMNNRNNMTGGNAMSGASMTGNVNAGTSDANGMPTDKMGGMDLGGKKKPNVGVYIACALVGIVVIAVIVATLLMNINKGQSNEVADEVETTGVDEAEENEILPNSELSSGTVTTTIDGKTISYKAAYVVDGVNATIGSGMYESSTDDETVFLVINGGSLTIEGEVEIVKNGSENFQGRGDNYSFYGMNSAIVVVGEGSSATISGVTISTNVSGANAVVATNGGTVEIRDSSIGTSYDNSRGLHATYGGSITADNVMIATAGGSCAALATDRGAGTVVASNMVLTTAGAGSPLIYSTGDITVSDSMGTAGGAQIAVVEGKNSITLSNCEFSASGIGNRNNVDNAGVMIYQSMSGDASVGTGSFTATGSTLTVLSGYDVYDTVPFFFVTNTNATINLTDTEVSFSEAEKFISAIGTSEWGRSGSNGGKVTVSTSELKATNTLVETDSISSVSGI